MAILEKTKTNRKYYKVTCLLQGIRTQIVKSNLSLRERRTKISDFSNTFSYTPDMYFLQNVIIFWLEQGIFSQIRFWKKFPIFLGQIFFWNFFEKFFFAINRPKKEFKAKKKISKNFKKKFWYKKIILKNTNLWKNT